MTLGPWRAAGPGPDGWRPTTNGSIDSDEVAVRCHWEEERDADRCALVLEAAADSWANQVDEIGFAAPVPDSDGILDVYLSDDGTGGGAYTDGSWTDAVEGNGRTTCAAYICIDPEVPDAELASYVAHEFNHVLQMATDIDEPTYPIWEGVASAAQTWTYPDDPYYDEYWTDFQATPWLGVLGDGYFLWDEYGLWSYYEYGSEIWIQHLDHTWGDGRGAGARDLWEAAVQEGPFNEPDVLDALGTVSGLDWRESVMAFSAARVRVGTALNPDWSALDDPVVAVSLEDTVALGDLPAELSPEVGPYETGAVYVAVSGLGLGERLAVSVESDAVVAWGLLAVVGEEDEWTAEGELTVTGDGLHDAVVGVVNLGAPDFDGDDRIRSAAVTLRLQLDGSTDAEDDTAGDADGPTPPAGQDDGRGGCGCGTGGGGTAWLPLLVAAGLRRRRTVNA